MQPDYDVLIIGSGFGGSVTALRLDREGLPRRRARGRPALRRRRVRQDVVESAQVPLDAEARHVRHPAHPPAAQRDDPGGRGRRRRLAELRQHALRAAGAVLQRPAVEAHHRLARRADAALRAGAADARRGHEPDVHRRRPDHEGGRRRHGCRRHLRPDAGRACSSGRTATKTPGKTVPDPYFGGAGPGPHRLHRVRLVHDRVPVRRQEHPGEELPRARGNALARRCIR